MHKLSTERRAQVISCLVEGNSIRATVRMTGVAKNTVVKLLADLGAACAEYQDGAMQDLTCKRIQCDEIWSFCYAKAKSVPEDHQDEYGDVWTWVAIDADTKLVPSYSVGDRSDEDGYAFLSDLAVPSGQRSADHHRWSRRLHEVHPSAVRPGGSLRPAA